jgi:hypothetical protein
VLLLRGAVGGYPVKAALSFLHLNTGPEMRLGSCSPSPPSGSLLWEWGSGCVEIWL